MGEKYLFILGIRAEMPNSYIYKVKREIKKPNGCGKKRYRVALGAAVDLADCEIRRAAP